jgi:quercetin dioxygenase-like cupin family protein
MLRRLADAETITRLERRDVAILSERPELTITWSRYAARERGPDLHVHREHTDAFYVLGGELTFAVGPAAERIRVPAGGFVAVPPNVVHTFANESGADAHWLNLHAPDTGFAAYLRAMRDRQEAGFDSFDPPADGGRPADAALVSGPGDGERDGGALVKGSLPQLACAEWALAGAFDGDADALYVLEGELERTLDGSTHVVGANTLLVGVGGALRSRGGTRMLGFQAPSRGTRSG